MAERARLMIPGPVDVDDEVLAALAEPVLPHYGKVFLALYDKVIARLRQVFGTQNDLLIIPGAGTSALEAAMGSMLRTGEKILVAQNGFFGRRLGVVAGMYGLDVCKVEAPLGQVLDPDEIRRCLMAEPEIQAVVAVHVETSTGVCNPIQEIAAICAEFGVPFILDAVSSVGGVPLPVDAWGIDVCVTVVNKCLACPPGMAPISISPRAWEMIQSKPDRAHGWYLNLEVWKEYAVKWPWHPTPITLPTNNIVALHTSLTRILDLGLEVYYARHVHAAQMVRDGLKRLGFKLFTDESLISPLVTPVEGPPGMDISDLQRFLMKEHQVMIAGGLEELAGKIFRIGHIGKAASAEYISALLEGIEAYLHQAAPAPGPA